LLFNATWMSDGVKRDRFGAWLGFGAGAHALFAAGAMLLAPSDLLRLVQSLRVDQRAMFTTRFDIGVEAPPRPVVAPTPTPPPEPAVVEAPAITPSPPAPPLMKPPVTLPTPPTPAPVREAIENHTHRFFEAAADAVAQAGKALTRDDEAPGGDSIASGDSNDPMYGLVAGGGTGNVPTRNPRAKVGGKVGGHGTSTRADAVLDPDLSRGAHAPSVITDACPFPAEADFARIDHASVVLQVHVLSDGHTGAISIISDPGHGFGRAAAACARNMIYSIARDRHGKSIEADAPPTTIRFTR
jgi:protein TonB